MYRRLLIVNLAGFKKDCPTCIDRDRLVTIILKVIHIDGPRVSPYTFSGPVANPV